MSKTKVQYIGCVPFSETDSEIFSIKTNDVCELIRFRTDDFDNAIAVVKPINSNDIRRIKVPFNLYEKMFKSYK